jgi:hypothetical protein
MFVSRPEYEFQFPLSLGPPEEKKWRVIELSLHVAWFLLSFETTHDDEDGAFGMTRTLCVAWDSDLADLLHSISIEGAHVKGIVCMLPAWQSPTGDWCARDVSEVWLIHSSQGKRIVFSDVAGKTFDTDFSSVPQDHEHEVKRELLLRISRGA